MNKAIRVDFWQFVSALNEWVDQIVIDRRKAEVFAMYAMGHSVQFVAGELERMEHEGEELE